MVEHNGDSRFQPPIFLRISPCSSSSLHSHASPGRRQVSGLAHTLSSLAGEWSQGRQWSRQPARISAGDPHPSTDGNQGEKAGCTVLRWNCQRIRGMIALGPGRSRRRSRGAAGNTQRGCSSILPGTTDRARLCPFRPLLRRGIFRCSAHQKAHSR